MNTSTILNIESRGENSQLYNAEDSNLITQFEVNNKFNPGNDYIEFYVYNGDNKLFPDVTSSHRHFKIQYDNVILSPSEDLNRIRFNQGTYRAIYNLYTPLLGSNIESHFYIEEISSDRTELKLTSNTISKEDIEDGIIHLRSLMDEADYYVDFHLNFGNNNTILGVNFKPFEDVDGSLKVLIKLYQPLPFNYKLKSTLWLVKEVSKPHIYDVTFKPDVVISNTSTPLRGPNFNLDVKTEIGKASKSMTYDDLITDSNGVELLVNKAVGEGRIKPNINYEEYPNFIYFSSAFTRLENFITKLKSLETLQTQVAYGFNDISITNQINSIKAGFDGYEEFLYYDYSANAYPKNTSAGKLSLKPTTNTTTLFWIGSMDESSQYYGGKALEAYNYDENNPNCLKNTIPMYLRESSDNSNYSLFVDMVAQQYDDIWLYTKDVTSKYDNDNRIGEGVNKELITNILKDRGLKIYSNIASNSSLSDSSILLNSNFNNTYGSAIYGTSLYSTSSYGSQGSNSSNEIEPILLPHEGVNGRIYKRLYHNLNYILKTKGTVRCLKTLLNCYGIPGDVIGIYEHGGKNNTSTQNWDNSSYIVNKSFTTTTGGYIETPFN